MAKPPGVALHPNSGLKATDTGYQKCLKSYLLPKVVNESQLLVPQVLSALDIKEKAFKSLAFKSTWSSL